MSKQRKTPKSKEICVVHDPIFIKTRNQTFHRFLNDIKDPVERFQKLQSVKKQRLTQPLDSANRLAKACSALPGSYESINKDHGYHRDCYQRFTGNLNRLIPATASTVPDEEEPPPKRTRLSSGLPKSDTKIFAPDCIFCNKPGLKAVKRGGVWTTEGLSKFEYGKGDRVQELMEMRGDEDLGRRIRGSDLFAAEACYHESCRAKYNHPTKWRSKDDDNAKEQSDLEKVHGECFEKVSEIIETKVIDQSKLMTMKDLHDIYCDALEKTQFKNPNYRVENLKEKIKNSKFSNAVGFLSVGSRKSEVIYSTSMPLSVAIKEAMDHLRSQDIKSNALHLREIIILASEKSEKLPWPLTAAALQNMRDQLPQELKDFLCLLFTGKSYSENISEKKTRLVHSIGQDICRAVTNGFWKLPKHIIISMALRHLFRSKKLNTLMSRLGHAETYTYALELETGIAKAVEMKSSVLTPQIIRSPKLPSIVHSDFDNLDAFINSLTGSGSIHTANGIILQHLDANEESQDQSAVSQPKVPKSRSFKVETHATLKPCYVTKKNRVGPKLTVRFQDIAGSKEAKKQAEYKQLLYFLVRLHASRRNKQFIPDWCGYVSEIGTSPERLTTIDYYPVINHPITNYSTVQECLRLSKEASKEVGQRYAVTTFDLDVVMRALAIIWKTPSEFPDNIVMMGTFHFSMAYLKMIGKKMKGSGFSEIVLESEIITSGSLKGVINGKNFYRSLNCHKLMLESLERLLLHSYSRHSKSLFRELNNNRSFKKLVDNRSNDVISQALEDVSLKQCLDDIIKYREDAREGSLGRTAQYWIQYMDHVGMLLLLDFAVRNNNYELYYYCMSKMAALFFAFNGHNYARYSAFYIVFLANIDVSHPGATELLKRGAISVARSFIPGNRCDVDKTIEETFMKHAKSKAGAGSSGAGITGIMTNYGAYQRWVRSAHERAKFLECALVFADMTDESKNASCHRNLRPSRIAKSEKGVYKVVTSIKSFMNPFDVDRKDRLFVLSSGAPVSVEIENDVLKADSLGRERCAKFIQERLIPNKDFHVKLPKLKLLTLDYNGKKVKVKASGNKLVEVRQYGNLAFQLLVKSQDHQLDLRGLMKYPLTPIPSSLGSIEGFLLRNDKRLGMHLILKDVKDVEMPSMDVTLYIEDGNAMFHSMKDIPNTFKDIAVKILALITAGRQFVVFSTDMYFDESPKAMEREIRGPEDTRHVVGVNMRRPQDWKGFLGNTENKKQYIKLLLEVWRGNDQAQRLTNKLVILVVEENAYRLTSTNGKEVSCEEITDLQSTQEETDTRVVIYARFAETLNVPNVVVRSPDCDVFFILLHHSSTLNQNVIMDTQVAGIDRVLGITKLSEKLTPEYASALLALHAYTRCDTTSAFHGVGKKKPIKKLKAHPEYIATFQKLGKDWEVSDALFNELEAFTCLMYMETNITSVDELRHQMLVSRCRNKKLDAKKKVDLSLLPPPMSCLKEHIKRVNYQVAIWRRAMICKPEIPRPYDDNGWSLVDGRIEPKWCSEETIPENIADFLSELDKGESDEDISDDEKENDDTSNKEDEDKDEGEYADDDDFDDDDDEEDDDDDDDDDDEEQYAYDDESEDEY